MTYTVKGPGPLICLLPYQFGFVPHDAFVVAYFNSNVLIACLRLDASATSEAAVMEEALRLPPGAAVIDNAMVISCDISQGNTGVQVLQKALRNNGLATHHIIETDHERWRAIRCDRGCCDGHWHAVDHAPDVAPIAELVARGIAPLGSREAAEAALRVRDHRQDIIDRYLRELPTADGEGCAWCQFLKSENPSDLVVARVLQSFVDLRRRDAAIWSLIPECFELSDGLIGPGSLRLHDCEINPRHSVGEPCATLPSDVVLSRMLQALPGIPQRWRSVWLCFISLARWRSGDHTGASMAAQCAAEESPESLASLCCMVLELRQPYQEFCWATSA